MHCPRSSCADVCGRTVRGRECLEGARSGNRVGPVDCALRWVRCDGVVNPAQAFAAESWRSAEKRIFAAPRVSEKVLAGIVAPVVAEGDSLVSLDAEAALWLASGP